MHITTKLPVFLLQLVDTLLLSRHQLADSCLALLLGLVLLHSATDRGDAESLRLADVRDAEVLFSDHTDDLKLADWGKTAALPDHVNSFEVELCTYRCVRGH